MKKILLIVILIIPFFVYSQKKHKIKFGKNLMEDLKRNVCELDSTASAEVIFDVGRSYFTTVGQDGFKLNYERHFRIKIYSKEAYHYGNIKIYLYKNGNDKDAIIDFKAKTYSLENGKILEHKLKKKNLLQTNETKYKDVATAAFLAVKEGVIIECKYTIMSDFYLNIEDWNFQKDIPVRYSNYTTRIPEFFYYRKNVKNFDAIYINKEESNIDEQFSMYYKSLQGPLGHVDKGYYDVSSNSKITEWTATNVPAFKEEEYISSVKNYIAGVDYELSYIRYSSGKTYNYNTSWNEIDKDLLNSYSFGKKIIPNKFIREKVKEITAIDDTKLQKANKIYHFVNQNVKWNNFNGLEKNNDKSFKKILKEGKGSSNDINLMLVTMLKAAGINACPMLISTREHGLIYPSFPSITQFNYVIAKVSINKEIYFIDATNSMLPMGLLPKRCLNGKGRSLCGLGKFEKIVPAGKRKSTKMYVLNVSEKGKITGNLSEKHETYSAYNLRTKINKNGGTNSYIEELESNNSEIKLLNMKFIDVDSIYKPVQIKSDIEISSNKYIQKAGNMIYLSTLLDNAIEENPFKLETRKYPVDYAYPISETVIVQYKIPEGYELIEQPKVMKVTLPEKAGAYYFSVAASGNTIQIMSKFQINKALFIYEDYQSLKKFYDLVIKKQAEKIVLKKK